MIHLETSNECISRVARDVCIHIHHWKNGKHLKNIGLEHRLLDVLTASVRIRNLKFLLKCYLLFMQR